MTIYRSRKSLAKCILGYRYIPFNHSLLTIRNGHVQRIENSRHIRVNRFNESIEQVYSGVLAHRFAITTRSSENIQIALLLGVIYQFEPAKANTELLNEILVRSRQYSDSTGEQQITLSNIGILNNHYPPDHITPVIFNIIENNLQQAVNEIFRPYTVSEIFDGSNIEKFESVIRRIIRSSIRPWGIGLIERVPIQIHHIEISSLDMPRKILEVLSTFMTSRSIKSYSSETQYSSLQINDHAFPKTSTLHRVLRSIGLWWIQRGEVLSLLDAEGSVIFEDSGPYRIIRWHEDVISLRIRSYEYATRIICRSRDGVALDVDITTSIIVDARKVAKTQYLTSILQQDFQEILQDLIHFCLEKAMQETLGLYRAFDLTTGPIYSQLEGVIQSKLFSYLEPFGLVPNHNASVIVKSIDPPKHLREMYGSVPTIIQSIDKKASGQQGVQHEARTLVNQLVDHHKVCVSSGMHEDAQFFNIYAKRLRSIIDKYDAPKKPDHDEEQYFWDISALDPLPKRLRDETDEDQ